jgi:putative tricarboxylic transport membrane protein
LAGFFFLIFGIAVTFGALDLPLGTPLDPRPGFFPLLAGIFLTGVSFIHLVRAFSKGTSGMPSFGAWWRPASLMAGMAIYSVILDFVGYVVATIILSVIILRISETKKWWKIIAVSFAASLGSYVLFDRILGVTLSPGLLRGIL